VETLVLNPGYEPIARVPWQRAVTLIFLNKVEVVEAYDDRHVRSVTLVFNMPSVVRLFRAFRRGKKMVRFSRENVYLRDAGRCQYCGATLPRGEATYDHVVPRALGGQTTWTNIVIACLRCNQQKGGRTPDQAKMKLRAVPQKPRKLPDSVRVTLSFGGGIPESWKTWVRDYNYWNTELDE
jgi:5-methylcytosine-specific restriction endonuclease McrA